jgi:hypothetical protein
MGQENNMYKIILILIVVVGSMSCNRHLTQNKNLQSSNEDSSYKNLQLFKGFSSSLNVTHFNYGDHLTGSLTMLASASESFDSLESNGEKVKIHFKKDKEGNMTADVEATAKPNEVTNISDDEKKVWDSASSSRNINKQKKIEQTNKVIDSSLKIWVIVAGLILAIIALIFLKNSNPAKNVMGSILGVFNKIKGK